MKQIRKGRDENSKRQKGDSFDGTKIVNRPIRRVRRGINNKRLRVWSYDGFEDGEMTHQ